MLQPAKVQQAIKRAVLCYQRGRFAEAELLYKDVLRAQPQHFDALQLLGALRIAQRDYRSGADLIQRAVHVNPHFPKAHFNLGLALQELEQYHGALASFDRVLAMQPDHVDALNSRAGVLLALDRCEEALASCDRALAIRADLPAVYCNRAAVLSHLERHDDALASADRAVQLRPDAEAFYRRGEVLLQAARPAEAIESYDQALRFQETYPEALRGRGNALAALDRHEDAIECYNRALLSRPEYVDALSQRGAAQAALRRYDESLADYAKALALAPTHADTLYNRGLTLFALRRYQEAFGSFQAAVASQPRNPRILNNCGFALTRLRYYTEAIEYYNTALQVRPHAFAILANKADALRMLGSYDAAIAVWEEAFAVDPESSKWSDGYFYSKQFACQWTDFDSHEQRIREGISDPATLSAPLLLMSVRSDRAEQLAGARKFVAQRAATFADSLEVREVYDHPRIRVAYLSANFCQHPVAYSIVGLLENHDRAKFEIIGISFGVDDKSDIRARVVAAFDQFHDVSHQLDLDIARLVRDLEVDIAVDLMGHTDDARPSVLAYRPAPVQVNYLGYPGTMGAAYVDYLLADPFVIPADHQEHYQERVVRLPHCYFPIDPKRRVPDSTPTRSQYGLPDRGFVFCSFNTHHKIGPWMFAVWMRILAAVPDAVLWLQGNNPSAQKNLRLEAQASGIDPDRLVFAPRLDRIEEHLARHCLADLFLDTFPYNAHTTARDALWAGLPVLTCSGMTFASRVAGSLLQAAGLPELIAEDLGQYELLAVRLARDGELLARLRSKLNANRTTAALFDADSFRRHVEAAYATMLEIHRRGEPAQSFNVPATT